MPLETRTELARRLAGMAESHGVADLYVFGSRAAEIAAHVRGTSAWPAPTGSDVDIAVRPKPGFLEHVDDRVALTFALEDLFGVSRVDLVILPESPPFLALDIVRGELLYYADAYEQIEYELYILRRAADLAPLNELAPEDAPERWMGADEDYLKRKGPEDPEACST